MLNGLKRFASAVIAITIAFTFVGAFTRLNENQVNADTAAASPAVTYSLSGKTRMQYYGNRKASFSNGVLTLGKRSKKKNVYAITINFKNNTGYQGGIAYSVYRQKKGWTAWKTSGQLAGSKSSKKYRIEAVRIALTGELAKHYSVEYCAYMQTYKGNQGWVSDGTAAGAQGEKKRLEEIKVRLVSRDQMNEQPTVSYRMYRDKYKWGSKWYKDGAVAGVTSGSYQKHEGLQMSVTGSKYLGNIEYRAKGDGYSWTSWASKNGKVGKYSKGKRMEEIEIRLTGELAEHFDIYYRTFAKSKGWLGWAKNGEKSGTEKYNYYIMALQCVIVPKGTEPGTVNGVTSKYTSSYLVNGNPVMKFADFKADRKTSKTMVGIDVSKYQGDINFKKAKAAGVEFVILRCYVRNNYYDKTKKKYVWCNAPDTKFEQYYKDAKAAGMKVGVYFFTCDYTEENMRKFTQDMIAKCKLSEKEIDFPIAFDWENYDYYKRAHKSEKWTTAQMNKNVNADLNKMVAIFEEECNKAGFAASIYGSKSRLEGTWSPSIKNMNAGKNNLSIWMAHWVSKSSYKGDYYMWQANSHGRVPGISGDVDLDVAFIDRLPSPKAPVKPEDPKDPDQGGTDKPSTEDEGTKPEETTPEGTTPEEGAQTPAEEESPEEGNATPEDGAKAPEDSDTSKANDAEAEDDESDEPVDANDASPDTENEPAMDVPVKEAEPEKKDATSSKDAEPAKIASAMEQPEEVRTEGP